MSDAPRVSPALVLAVAVTAISSAAVLFRMAEGVHPIAAAFWRTGVVGLLLAPSLRRFSFRDLRPRDIALMMLAGLFLATHFWSWLESLRHTTVLRSTLLVCLTPIWAAVLGWALLGERPHSRTLLGIGVAILGVAVMTYSGTTTVETTVGASFTGEALAVVGGVLSAAYLLVGRSVRQRVGIGPYGSLVCLATAGWLLPMAVLQGIPLYGFETQSWMAIAGLTLGPQLLGHIGLNYAVGFLPAAVVSSAVLVEPVGAAALGALLLAEVPTLKDMVGSVVVLMGVGLATLKVRETKSE